MLDVSIVTQEIKWLSGRNGVFNIEYSCIDRDSIVDALNSVGGCVVENDTNKRDALTVTLSGYSTQEILGTYIAMCESLDGLRRKVIKDATITEKLVEGIDIEGLFNAEWSDLDG